MSEERYLHCRVLFTDGVYRMNQVERLADGRLFTLACIGKADRDGHFSTEPVSQFLIGRTSSDEGKTWQAPSFFFEFPEKEGDMYPGSFLIDRCGRIHAFFLRIFGITWKTAGTTGDIMYLRMDDETGRNLIFKKLECLDRYSGSMNNLIELGSGRIVAPFSTLSGAEGSAFVSSVVYSDDGGDTWSASNDVEVISDEEDVESGAVEPVVTEAAPGVLVMLIRTVRSRLWYAVSYDEGASWTEAAPTKIPSSNAPSVPLVLRDGRILLSWNDVLGEPMRGVRYSFARQCLHAAVSKDGLRTLEGVRIIVRKRACDPDRVLNCYPFASHAGDGGVFLRPFSVYNDDVHWGEPQGTLLLLHPDDLLETETDDHFEEWITDCVSGPDGLCLTATKENVAYACVNFPYAQEGEITLGAAGENVPAGAKILLSDCYLDRLNFLPEKREGRYAKIVGRPYVEAGLPAGGNWRISWDKEKLTVAGKETLTVPLRSWGRGFNHMILLFEGEGRIDIRTFHMKAVKGGMETGISY